MISPIIKKEQTLAFENKETILCILDDSESFEQIIPFIV